MDNTKKPALFYGVITFAVVALLLSIYYAIPNIYHIPIPAESDPTMVHYKYVGFFAGLTALGVIGALLARPKADAK